MEAWGPCNQDVGIGLYNLGTDLHRRCKGWTQLTCRKGRTDVQEASSSKPWLSVKIERSARSVIGASVLTA